MATTIENDLATLRESLANVHRDVEAQFTSETVSAKKAAEEAEESLGQAQAEMKIRQQEAHTRSDRLADLEARQYTTDDQRRIEQAVRIVKQQHSAAVERATDERNDAAALVERYRFQDEQLHNELQAAEDNLEQLNRSLIPPVVQDVIQAAVDETTSAQDRLVSECQEKVDRLAADLSELDQRHEALDRKAGWAQSRHALLEEARTRRVSARLLCPAWWGSFVTDYERVGAKAYGGT